MQIVIMGAGGLGAYFGALLTRAGEDVTLIARGLRLEAFQKNGVTLQSKIHETFTIPVKATSQLNEIGTVDLILFCVKTYDLDAAAEQIRPLIGSATIVLPVQNGIEAAERIAAIVGAEHVLQGVTYVAAQAEQPHSITHMGGEKLLISELDGATSSRCEHLRTVLQHAGIAAEIPADMQVALWEKFIRMVANAISPLTRLPVGPMFACPETKELYCQTLAEGVALAQAKGVPIAPTFIEDTLELVSTYPPSVAPSMYYDIVAGRRLEVDALNGTIVRVGQELGIATPANFVIYAALKPYANGAPALPTAATR